MNWARLRVFAYLRDMGRCQVCLEKVGRVWDLGHLIDRCVGGADELENVYVMCQHCNRTTKPVHRTREEALEWVGEQRRLATGLPLANRDDWEAFLFALYGRRKDDVYGGAGHALAQQSEDSGARHRRDGDARVEH